MWHSQYRQTEKPHEDYWYQDTEENLMKEYINRHSDESVLTVLDELRRDAIYSCSDPRMHIKERAQVTKLTMMQLNVTRKTSRTCMRQLMNIFCHCGYIPYCVILQMLAMRYLGASLLDPDFIDKDYPYRSLTSFSCMFWNFGNCRPPRMRGVGLLFWGGYYLNK